MLEGDCSLSSALSAKGYGLREALSMDEMMRVYRVWSYVVVKEKVRTGYLSMRGRHHVRECMCACFFFLQAWNGSMFRGSNYPHM